MTEAGGEPVAWADQPRAPISVVVSGDLADRLVRRAWLLGQGRSTVARLIVSALVGLVVAWPRGIAVGAAVALALAVFLGLGPLLLVRARVGRTVSPGDVRTTGYDREGRLVLQGRAVRTFAAGWARSVEREGGLAVVRPRGRSVPALVLPAELVTDADEAFLVRQAPARTSTARREVSATPALRRGVRRAVLRTLGSRPLLVVAGLLVALELVVGGSTPWPWPLVLAGASLLVAALAVAVALALLVHWRYRDGRVLRSEADGTTLRLEGGLGLPAELHLGTIRSGTVLGPVVRVRHGAGWVVVPLELVPPEARPGTG